VFNAQIKSLDGGRESDHSVTIFSSLGWEPNQEHIFVVCSVSGDRFTRHITIQQRVCLGD